jgi:hypothetical protein
MFYPPNHSEHSPETTSSASLIRPILTLCTCLVVIAGVASAAARASVAHTEPLTTLQIVVREPGAAPVTRYVECPTWGPANNPSCRKVGTVLRLAHQRPRLCLQIWGGPATAEIRGFIHGRPVRLHLTRSDSCEIARWGELRALLDPS